MEVLQPVNILHVLHSRGCKVMSIFVLPKVNTRKAAIDSSWWPVNPMAHLEELEDFVEAKFYSLHAPADSVFGLGEKTLVFSFAVLCTQCPYQSSLTTTTHYPEWPGWAGIRKKTCILSLNVLHFPWSIASSMSSCRAWLFFIYILAWVLVISIFYYTFHFIIHAFFYLIILVLS